MASHFTLQMLCEHDKESESLAVVGEDANNGGKLSNQGIQIQMKKTMNYTMIYISRWRRVCELKKHSLLPVPM